MRTYVVPPHEPVEQELHGRYVDVIGEPPSSVGAQAADPEPEVARADEDAHDPSDGHGWVVGQHQDVMQHGARPEPECHPPDLAEYGIEGSRRPAGLLAEELGPRTWPLAHRDKVRGVDRPPRPARLLVLGGVDDEARGHVLGDG